MIGFLATAALLATPAGTPKTLDLTSFTIPAGFEISEAKDHVTFRRVDAKNWILFSIYTSRAAAGALPAEFANDWNDLLSTAAAPAPAPAARRIGAASAVEGGVYAPKIGWVDLVEIDAGGAFVSIIVECGSADGFKEYRPLVESVLSTVAVKPAPARSAPQANAASATPIAVAQKMITIADMVGHWEHSEGSSVGYVDSYSGNYAGSSTIFYGESYDLKADGTYTFKFAGMSNSHMVKESDAGKWGFENGKFVIHAGTTRKTDRVETIKDFQSNPDGSASFEMGYYEKWTRKPKGAK